MNTMTMTEDFALPSTLNLLASASTSFTSHTNISLDQLCFAYRIIAFLGFMLVGLALAVLIRRAWPTRTDSEEAMDRLLDAAEYGTRPPKPLRHTSATPAPQSLSSGRLYASYDHLEEDGQ